MKNILIAIPARGGSKRLLRKNLFKINGKPLLVYTIEEAIKSNLSDVVYVCTEDDEIAAVSESNGAEVFRIDKKMAGDLVSSTIPCLALYNYLSNQGEDIDYIFNLQPTSPLRNAFDINNALNKIDKEDADFLVSTTEIDPHYFHWALKNNDSKWEIYFGKKFMLERPLLPKIYRPNGAIKLAKAEVLKKTGNFFGANLTTYEMPNERSIHISTLFDIHCVNGIINSSSV